MKHSLVLLLFFCFCKLAFAQNISGSWFGVGKVENVTDGNSYLTELVLEQKGRNITGSLNYYFRDSFFTYKIYGTFDGETRKLKINTANFIFHKSTSTSTGVDCPMSAEFILRIAKTESVITGYFFADKNYRFTCPPIHFKLKKYIPTNEEVPTETKEEVKEKDTIVTKQVVDTTNNEDKKQKEAEFEKRSKTYIKEIIVTNNTLRLEFYDNGAIDYDSISVFLNNKLIIPKAKLEHKAIKVTIQLDEKLPFNELSMFAESLGYIPPNTAALVIYDGSKRYDVLMTSDFNVTSTIKLIKQKE